MEVVVRPIAIPTAVEQKVRWERVVSQGNCVTIKRSSQADATLGGHIRARRKSIGMTQSELASSMGISFQQVQKYEKGISAVSMSRLQQICEIMHLSPDYFIKNSSNQFRKSAQIEDPRIGDQNHLMEQFLSTGEGKHLVQCFMRIRDGKMRTRILDFIAAVASDQPD